MNVNGKSIPTGGALATIDTGTSLMIIPEVVADTIHAAIPGSFKDVSKNIQEVCSSLHRVRSSLPGYTFCVANERD